MDAIFLEVKGYKLQDNILFQDNQSAIKMETHGRRSCTGIFLARAYWTFLCQKFDRQKINPRIILSYNENVG